MKPAEKRVVEAAMALHKLNGTIDVVWLSRLHPADRGFYKACAALHAARKGKK